jgi:hypothetical protein
LIEIHTPEGGFRDAKPAASGFAARRVERMVPMRFGVG